MLTWLIEVVDFDQRDTNCFVYAPDNRGVRSIWRAWEPMAASWWSVSRNELTDPPALQLDRRCSWQVSPKRALRSS